MILAVITEETFTFFWLLLFLVLFSMAAVLFYNVWLNRTHTVPSPYSGQPLRRGTDIHWLTGEKVLRYLFDLHDYHNQLFNLNRAAYCRETGRIFPEAITWYGSVKVEWDFLQKRYPGHFVSWGSLTELQKITIIDKHESMEGFQTEFSSPTASPMKIEPFYADIKPGPLYVDVNSGVLLGWKCVPDTELEVLIVQKPIEKYLPGLHKKY